jgi:hypothetical protein
MTARWTLAVSAAIAAALVALGGGCPKREPSADTPPRPGPSADPPKPGPGDTAMPSSNPWDQARTIAEKSGASGPSKWKDDVPYLFQAKGSRGVLVHNGAVVTARGPAVAGAYLRDLGVLDGNGPSPDSLLTLLYVLQAFPAVEGLPEQSAVDTLGPPDLQPRIERAGGHAKVILSYRLPRDPGPSRGTVPVMRETLDIGPSGDAAWTGERIDWKLP